MKKIERFAKAHGFKYSIDEGGGCAKVEAGTNEYFIRRVNGVYELTVYLNSRQRVGHLRASTQGALVTVMENDVKQEGME